MALYRDSLGNVYEISRQMGEGAFGGVYELVGESRLVVKSFHFKGFREAEYLRLNALVPPSDGSHRWPQAHTRGTLCNGGVESPAFLEDRMPGVRLSDFYAGRPGRYLRDSLEIMGAVFDTLALLAEQGAQHGDLHPGNVLVERTPAGLLAHLVDFGQLVSPRQIVPEQTALRASPGCFGTMSPEVAAVGQCPSYSPWHNRKHEGSGIPYQHLASADVWSAGALLHHLVTGCFPAQGECDEALRMWENPDTPLNEVFFCLAPAKVSAARSFKTIYPKDRCCAGTNEDYEFTVDFIARAMAEDPDERPSASEARDDIYRYLASTRRTAPARGGEGHARERSKAAFEEAVRSMGRAERILFTYLSARLVLAEFNLMSSREATDAIEEGRRALADRIGAESVPPPSSLIDKWLETGALVTRTPYIMAVSRPDVGVWYSLPDKDALARMGARAILEELPPAPGRDAFAGPRRGRSDVDLLFKWGDSLIACCADESIDPQGGGFASNCLVELSRCGFSEAVKTAARRWLVGPDTHGLVGAWACCNSMHVRLTEGKRAVKAVCGRGLEGPFAEGVRSGAVRLLSRRSDPTLAWGMGSACEAGLAVGELLCKMAEGIERGDWRSAAVGAMGALMAEDEPTPELLARIARAACPCLSNAEALAWFAPVMVEMSLSRSLPEAQIDPSMCDAARTAVMEELTRYRDLEPGACEGDLAYVSLLRFAVSLAGTPDDIGRVMKEDDAKEVTEVHDLVEEGLYTVDEYVRYLVETLRL